ncbi:fructose-1,6-bisphosphatase [Patescibacteria group bacterium]
MKNLKDYLVEIEVPSDLVSVIESVVDGIKKIANRIAYADIGKAGTKNVYGEEQMALDVLSNNLLIDELKENELIGLIASEELEDEQKLSDGEYALCFDPLDGSSLIDVNLAIGTILAIYKTDTFVGVKGDDQLAALTVSYGPRTTMLLTVCKGVVEFTLNQNLEFVMTKENLKIEEGKMFAPGNLRACSKREDYLELVNYWCRNEYKLRYSGGFVPDVGQIIIKGKGIFTYPGFEDAPDGKLRLLVECAPVSLLVEQAGGAASDGNVRILEKTIEKIDQRTPIYIGSKEEVERSKEFLNG